MYSLKLLKAKMLKTYIKINLVNSLIKPSKSLLIAFIFRIYKFIAVYLSLFFITNSTT